MRFLELPEEASDSPVKIILRDALDESNKVEREAWIVRTEGALNEQSLDLFAIARIDDPFGRESGRAPLRIGQPVSAKVPGRPFEKVVVIPRKAVRQLSRITVVDRDSHTITKRMVTPLWENDTDLIVSDESLIDGTLLATAFSCILRMGLRLKFYRTLLRKVKPLLLLMATMTRRTNDSLVRQ
jgi:hypothetical protein